MAKASRTTSHKAEFFELFHRKKRTPGSLRWLPQNNCSMSVHSNKIRQLQDLRFKRLFSRVSFSSTVAACIVLMACGCSERGNVTQIKFFPPAIRLDSANARQHVVVQATYSDGTTRDVTSESFLSVLNPRLAHLEHGLLAPVADGKTELHATYRGRTVSAPLT